MAHKKKYFVVNAHCTMHILHCNEALLACDRLQYFLYAICDGEYNIIYKTFRSQKAQSYKNKLSKLVFVAGKIFICINDGLSASECALWILNSAYHIAKYANKSESRKNNITVNAKSDMILFAIDLINCQNRHDNFAVQGLGPLELIKFTMIDVSLLISVVVLIIIQWFPEFNIIFLYKIYNMHHTIKLSLIFRNIQHK